MNPTNPSGAPATAFPETFPSETFPSETFPTETPTTGAPTTETPTTGPGPRAGTRPDFPVASRDRRLSGRARVVVASALACGAVFGIAAAGAAMRDVGGTGSGRSRGGFGGPGMGQRQPGAFGRGPGGPGGGALPPDNVDPSTAAQPDPLLGGLLPGTDPVTDGTDVISDTLATNP